MSDITSLSNVTLSGFTPSLVVGQVGIGNVGPTGPDGADGPTGPIINGWMAGICATGTENIPSFTNVTATLETKLFDTTSDNSMVASPVNDRITISRTGNYLVIINTTYDGDLTIIETRLLVNGSEVRDFFHRWGNSLDHAVSEHTIWRFTAGDYIQLSVRVSSGGSRVIGNASNYGMKTKLFAIYLTDDA